MSTAALAVMALLAAPGAAHEKRCGDVSGPPDAPQDVRALNVSCPSALRLARRHFHRALQGQVCYLGKPSCVLDGWTCRRSFFGNSGTRVRCTKGDRRVRFFYGV